MFLLGAYSTEADYTVYPFFTSLLLESRITKYPRWLFSTRCELTGRKKPYPKHSVQPHRYCP